MNYEYNFKRTGLVKETESFRIKANSIDLIQTICKTKNVPLHFDMFLSCISKFQLMVTGTNYGLYITVPNNKFEKFVFDNFAKTLTNVLHKNLSNELNISKYNERKYTFDRKINGVAIIPGDSKIPILNFQTLNKFVESNNNYIKLHPVMSYDLERFLEFKYGRHKLIESHYILEDVIDNSNEVAITANTEGMIPASIMNKKLTFLTYDNFNINNIAATYPMFYHSLKNNISIETLFNTDYTGLILWSMMDKNYIEYKIEKMRKLYEIWEHSVSFCAR